MVGLKLITSEKRQPREPLQGPLMLSGRHIGDLGDFKIYPILQLSHLVPDGTSRNRMTSTSEIARFTRSPGLATPKPVCGVVRGGCGGFSLLTRIPQDSLRKLPLSVRRRGSLLSKPKKCLPQRLTNPGAPSQTEESASCPEIFWVKLPLSY